MNTYLDKPAEIVMESAKGTFDLMQNFGDLQTTENWDWSNTGGGNEHSEFSVGTGWNIADDTIDPNLNITLTHLYDSYGGDSTITNNGTTSFEQAIGSLAGSSYLPGLSTAWSSGDYNTHVKMTLHTGGKGTSTRQNLFQLTATATKSLTTPPYSQSVAPQQISVAGKTLGSDGLAWTAFPDNSSQDVTPQVGAPYYDFTVAATKYHPYIGLTTSTMNANLDTDVPEVCVGQTVTLGLDWQNGIPPYQSVDNVWWHLPDKYVNEQYPYSSVCSSYRKNDSLLTTPAIQCWYVNLPGGACSARETLHFSNGQSVNIAAAGSFTVYRPEMTSFTPLFPPYIPMLTNGWVELGNASGPQENWGVMRFQATVASKSNFPGLINWLQLNDRHVDFVPILSTSGFELDNGVESGGYQVSPTGSAPFVDNPGISTAAWPSISITDYFQTYLQFKPDGDGIWVTLGYVTWGWSEDEWFGTRIISSSVNSPFYIDYDGWPVWLAITYSTIGT